MAIRIYFILILALLSVSSTSIVIRSLPFVPALTMAFWRMMIASAFLWLYSFYKKPNPLRKKSLNQVALAGFFFGFAFCVFFLGS